MIAIWKIRLVGSRQSAVPLYRRTLRAAATAQPTQLMATSTANQPQTPIEQNCERRPEPPAAAADVARRVMPPLLPNAAAAATEAACCIGRAGRPAAKGAWVKC